MENILLLGAGGHAHSVVDSIEEKGIYNIIGFLDIEFMQERKFRNYQVLGTDADMQSCFNNGIRNAFVTIGFMGRGNIRNKLYDQLKKIGYTIPNIIANTAVVSKNAIFGNGIFVGKGAVVNSGAKIGNMCIINTGAIVEHGCIVEEYSHIAVGSVLCGDVSVGRETLVGANATVIQGRKIGSNCIIGAGVTIRKNIEDNNVVLPNDLIY